jgi:hypothetical protein
LIWPLFFNSRYRNGPLYNTLEETIGPEQLRAVARRPEPGLLCVATVEIRSGELVKWNLTGIAEKFVRAENETIAENWLALYRRVLVAATSVPGAFPPQKIVMPEFETDKPLPFATTSWHIDAGVRAQVFGDVGDTGLINLYADFLNMVVEMDTTNALAPAEIVLIINNSNGVDKNWSAPSVGLMPLLKYAGRSLTLILNQTARDSREKLIEGVRHRLGEPGEGSWHLHIASMTDEELLDCESLNFGCASAYFTQGEARGAALAWDQTSAVQ